MGEGRGPGWGEVVTYSAIFCASLLILMEAFNLDYHTAFVVAILVMVFGVVIEMFGTRRN